MSNNIGSSTGVGIILGVLVFCVVLLVMKTLSGRAEYERKIIALRKDLINCDSDNIQLEKQLTQAEIKCATGQMEVHETLLQCMEKLMQDAKEEVDIMKGSKNVK